MGFSLLRWERGSETPSCGGEKGLRLPRSLGRSMTNEGVSDPFPHRKRESQTLFPPQKGKPRTSQNPLSEDSGESKRQPLNGSRRMVRKSARKRTAKNGQKQTAQKVRKRAKKCENGRKQAKTSEKVRKTIGMLFGDRFLGHFPVAI